MRRTVLTTLAFVALGVYIARVALPAARANTGGFATAYTAAYLLAHTPHEMEQVYNDTWFAAQIPKVGLGDVHDIFYIQPPTMSLILLPLAGLSPPSARLVWVLVCLLLLLSGLLLLVRTLRLPTRWGLWALPACLLYAPVTENIRFAHVYVLLFFLLCVLFWALGRQPQGVTPPLDGNAMAGATLGLMFVLKTAAVWLWPLLLLSGRWRVVFWATVLAVSVMLISLPVIGLKPWLIYITLLPDLSTTSMRYVTPFQTVTSLFGHLFIYDPKWNPSPMADYPLVARTLTLVVLLVTLICSVRWGRVNALQHEVRVLTLALFLTLTVANTPIGEGYHYTMILLPLLVACWWAWRGKVGWNVWGVLGVAGLLLGAPLPYQSSHLMAGWRALFAYPRVYGAYLLWGWLGWTLCTLRHTMEHHTEVVDEGTRTGAEIDSRSQGIPDAQAARA